MKKFFLALIVFVLYFPILFLAFYSFNSAGNMTSFEGFTLEYYRNVLTDDRLMSIIFNTLSIALISSSIATIFGLSGALMLYLIRSKHMRSTYLSINNILIVSPDVIIGSSFLILFMYLGIQLGFMSVLLSHIAFSIPIATLMILPKLYEMNDEMINAAIDLGASKLDVLTKIVLPNIKPGLIAAFLMSLTYSLDDFAVSFFVTGNGFSVLSVEIYSMARKGITMEINAISTLIFVIVMILIAVYYMVTQRGRKEVQS
ncbi:ABC transporter permease [Abyssicoccus albus]|uniref:Spermidine/putrescine transport system permease protein n=1 Tax=Abyssicoccus albus TaxID=1817405 RepID=A0A3N5BKM6_9BACL|nr:ABC transporter permease [Abyssicoccus albus]RPF58243.1 spermidine/putrescine transport system permease protein [Abyssicoccus albus]